MFCALLFCAPLLASLCLFRAASPIVALGWCARADSAQSPYLSQIPVTSPSSLTNNIAPTGNSSKFGFEDLRFRCSPRDSQITRSFENWNFLLRFGTSFFVTKTVGVVWGAQGTYIEGRASKGKRLKRPGDCRSSVGRTPKGAERFEIF